MHFEASGANGFELPRRRPLGRHGLQGRGLRRGHRSNANIQQRPISTATPWRREVPVRRRESRHREALADVQPLTNRHTKFVALAFESSAWTDSTLQRLVNVWEQQPSRPLGPDRRWSPRHRGEIQYWNSVSLSSLGTLVSKSPYLDEGWPSFGRRILLEARSRVVWNL